MHILILIIDLIDIGGHALLKISFRPDCIRNTVGSPSISNPEFKSMPASCTKPKTLYDAKMLYGTPGIILSLNKTIESCTLSKALAIFHFDCGCHPNQFVKRPRAQNLLSFNHHWVALPMLYGSIDQYECLRAKSELNGHMRPSIKSIGWQKKLLPDSTWISYCHHHLFQQFYNYIYFSCCTLFWVQHSLHNIAMLHTKVIPSLCPISCHKTWWKIEGCVREMAFFVSANIKKSWYHTHLYAQT